MNSFLKLLVDTPNNLVSELFKIKDCVKCEKLRSQMESFMDQTFDESDTEYGKSILDDYISQGKLKLSLFVYKVIDHKNLDKQKSTEIIDHFKSIYVPVNSLINGMKNALAVKQKKEASFTPVINPVPAITPSDNISYNSDLAHLQPVQPVPTNTPVQVPDNPYNALAEILSQQIKELKSSNENQMSDMKNTIIKELQNKKKTMRPTYFPQNQIQDIETDDESEKQKHLENSVNVKEEDKDKSSNEILNTILAFAITGVGIYIGIKVFSWLFEPKAKKESQTSQTVISTQSTWRFSKTLQPIVSKKDAQQAQTVKTEPTQTTPQLKYSVESKSLPDIFDFSKIVSNTLKNQEPEYDDQGNLILTARQMANSLY